MSERLILQYTPTLFLHPDETFVPVDAKRYVENAALWSAKAPYDDKATWGGGPGTSFPRRPLVAAGGLAGRQNEPGQLIDDVPLMAAADEEMFLDLAGWKDAAGTSEPNVTASSGNRYADRDAVAALYDDRLEAGKYWYHAEFFEGDRLTEAVRSAGPPDFQPYLTSRSALLLYYFFFPAHMQTLCEQQDITAIENSSYVGDWQCMGILFDGDGSGNPARYTPQYFGTTGSRMLYPDKASVRPQQFDDEGRTVMRVERWRPSSGPARALPEVDDRTHPRLYVALNSHSLHTTPGEKSLWPYPAGDGPNGCGTWDTPGLTPSDAGVDKDAITMPEAMAVFYAKFFAGLGNGGLFGAIAGIVLAAAEGAFPPPGINVVGFGSTADPDQVAPAGAGLTIKPRGVTVVGAGTQAQEWRAVNDLDIGRRQYSFTVNRERQRFWPHPDNEHGFRGRWGPRVTSDTVPRRAGPKFPDHLKMFMLALANGDAQKAFDDE